VPGFVNLATQGLPFFHGHAPTHATHLLFWAMVRRIAAGKRLAGAARRGRYHTVRIGRQGLTFLLLHSRTWLARATPAKTAREGAGNDVPRSSQEQERYRDIFKPRIHGKVDSSKRLTMDMRPSILKFNCFPWAHL
jgi:hypothetical protein